MNTCCREHFVYICRMSISEPVTGACEPDADILDLEPEIKDELDHLNQCSSEINRLENELDEARAKYRQTFHEASSKMSQVAQKRRKSITKAREYFELKTEQKMVQGESLKAARQYQSAIGIYKAAKETVALAEDRLVNGGETQLSSAWQEMLNHATSRVMDAEVEKRRSEEQHMKMTKRCAQLEQSLHTLERTKKRAINNARPYFELKHQFDLRLQQQKQNVTDLQSAIRQAKVKYSKSLHKLEEISLAIHESRRQKLMLMYPRQPGVGAEYDSLSLSVSELTLDSVGKDPGECNDGSSDEDETFDDAKDVLDDTPSDNFCSNIECKNDGVDKLTELNDSSELNNDGSKDNSIPCSDSVNEACYYNVCPDVKSAGEHNSSTNICQVQKNDKNDLHADD